MNWLRISRNEAPAIAAEIESTADEYGRKILYGLIASGTAIAASFDPQLESIDTLLLPVGSMGTVGFAVAGLRHVLRIRRSRRAS